MVDIPGKLYIPDNELRFTFSRCSGPGGQNVNKVNSRVTLWFDVASSPSLTEKHKIMLQRRLVNRISEAGILQVTASRYRTQRANREEVVRKFVDLLVTALTEQRIRKKSKLPRRAREKRLQAKKHRSTLKSVRAKKNWT